MPASEDAAGHQATDRAKGSLGWVSYLEQLAHGPEEIRTQRGRLHRVMQALMPRAVCIGFTGTPLLAKDRVTSLEVCGGFMHTSKFSEGVEDGVVLDLVYEARDIDQRLGAEDRIDTWFEAKTTGRNDWQQDERKTPWGTMQYGLSSRSRMERVVNDIVFDFSVQPRLSRARGTPSWWPPASPRRAPTSPWSSRPRARARARS